MSDSFSIVIATIGSASLYDTIKSIYSSSILPSEIIVVIPKVYRSNVIEYRANQVKYVYVDFMGQVNQRIYGFGLTKTEFVIQLDDDIIVDYYCFDSLLQAYKGLTGRRIVGPSFFFTDGSYAYNKPSFLNKLLSLFLFIKTKPATISSIGYGYGVNFSNVLDNYHESEWLAGGCILFHRDDLPNQVHFPFSGKAYCEDLIFSVLIRKKQFRIYIVKNAICYIEKPVLNSNNYDLDCDFGARKYLLSVLNISTLKLQIWYHLKKFFMILSRYS